MGVEERRWDSRRDHNSAILNMEDRKQERERKRERCFLSLGKLVEIVCANQTCGKDTEDRGLTEICGIIL